MFKDKELREALVDAGVLYESLDKTYSFKNLQDKINEQSQMILKLRRDLEIAMELLGIQHEPESKQKECFKKGNKIISIGKELGIFGNVHEKIERNYDKK